MVVCGLITRTVSPVQHVPSTDVSCHSWILGGGFLTKLRARVPLQVPGAAHALLARPAKALLLQEVLPDHPSPLRLQRCQKTGVLVPSLRRRPSTCFCPDLKCSQFWLLACSLVVWGCKSQGGWGRRVSAQFCCRIPRSPSPLLLPIFSFCPGTSTLVKGMPGPVKPSFSFLVGKLRLPGLKGHGQGVPNVEDRGRRYQHVLRMPPLICFSR